MPSLRRLFVALALTLAACGTDAPDTVATELLPAASYVKADAGFTPQQVQYLAAMAARDAAARTFLQHVAEIRAAVPHELRVIMWCEAGSYLGLPRYATNYQAMTHGYDGASGGAQMLGSTWLAWARAVGVDVTLWPRAFLAPDFVQDHVATYGYRTNGTRPWLASAGCWR